MWGAVSAYRFYALNDVESIERPTDLVPMTERSFAQTRPQRGTWSTSPNLGISVAYTRQLGTVFSDNDQNRDVIVRVQCKRSIVKDVLGGGGGGDGDGEIGRAHV